MAVMVAIMVHGHVNAAATLDLDVVRSICERQTVACPLDAQALPKRI